MTHKATIGSISRGTLRTVDLLEAFADELDRLESESDDVAEARAVLTLHNAGWLTIADSDEASELVQALQDALNEFAPSYCYFGTHEGDGSDFGFWPSMEAIDELPRINVHGNVTVYAADGSVRCRC